MLWFFIVSGFPIEDSGDEDADPELETRITVVQQAVIRLNAREASEVIARIDEDLASGSIHPSPRQAIRIQFLAAIVYSESNRWKKAFDTISDCANAIQRLPLDDATLALALVQIHYQRCRIAYHLLHFKDVLQSAAYIIDAIRGFIQAGTLAARLGRDHIRLLLSWAWLMRGWGAFSLNRLSLAKEYYLSSVSVIHDWSAQRATLSDPLQPGRELELIQFLQAGFSADQIIAIIQENQALKVHWIVLYLHNCIYFARLLPWRLRLQPGTSRPTKADWNLSGGMIHRVHVIITQVMARNLASFSSSLVHPRENVDRLLAIAEAAHSFGDADPNHRADWLQFSSEAIAEATKVSLVDVASKRIEEHYQYLLEIMAIEHDLQQKLHQKRNLKTELRQLQSRASQLRENARRYDFHFMTGYAGYVLGRITEEMQAKDEACRHYEQAWRLFSWNEHEHFLWAQLCQLAKARVHCPPSGLNIV